MIHYIIGVSLLVLFAMCFIINVEAESYDNTDKFDTLKVRHDSKPNVCIFQANPEITDKWVEIEYVTLKSVFDWSEKLTDKYPNGDWTFNIKRTIPWSEHADASPLDFPECNIMFNYETSSKKNYELGNTGLSFNKSWHKFTFINVFLENDKLYRNINLNMTSGESKISISLIKTPLSIPVIKNIIMHEFGHAIGLGHYTVNTIMQDGENGYDRSTMIPSIDPFNNKLILNVTNTDAYMIKEIYGETGWDGIKPVWHIKNCNVWKGLIYNCN